MADDGGSGAVAGRDESAVAATADPDADVARADWRGWLLVAVVALSLLVVPAVVALRPPRLPFEVAFLALPMLPAVLLGATAVWAAVRAREG